MNIGTSDGVLSLDGLSNIASTIAPILGRNPTDLAMDILPAELRLFLPHGTCWDYYHMRAGRHKSVNRQYHKGDQQTLSLLMFDQLRYLHRELLPVLSRLAYLQRSHLPIALSPFHRCWMRFRPHRNGLFRNMHSRHTSTLLLLL
jgi:hypothetical protein